MTMLSFRVEPDEARRAQQWAARLGVDKSQLLRDALHDHLVRLASEHDADRWANAPLSDDESALGEIADWGPAENWTDWADAAR
ncbi:MAG: ribbon-helix-helix protein, CopG family [Acidimicrobiia bacterium]|nr:ribbon-helix-helix protein, CopG family [Acidimicrobiia bacterium]